ncbi:tetraspanin-11 isoform X2 [Ursus arctos]|uniref:tetraspanin-11 isoform X2 n=1 Tax=Ursus arctos TaxID=9644 RepID=UPI000E6DB66D|nr:tetraspanin-11 isoform X2 [Ursus arctos]
MAHYKAEQDDWLIVYLKYLLFVFNFFFWYFCLLLVIFLVELVAGVLAHMYYQRLSDELKQHLTRTLAENYRQPGAAHITASVDRLQQDFKCCGSNSSADWQHSAYILSREAEGRRVPDSCCKTVVVRCGQRAHPSNIYKVEGGCITKLEQFLADHLLLMGAVGIGVACLQGNLRPSVHQMSFNPLSVLEKTLIMGRRKRGSPIRKPTDHSDQGPAYPFFGQLLPFLCVNGACHAYTCAMGSWLREPGSNKWAETALL